MAAQLHKFVKTSLKTHLLTKRLLGFPGSDSKVSACTGGDLGSISGSGRSPGEGNGNPPQYSHLKNPVDRGTWQATVYWVTRVRRD